ncbi:hypothetical protein [Paenibacillus sp. J2TS4]|uniref:hypothetical protein n=1 Tax=Paenibacillus sp. J2TS4 TaxID=2807194 RepID=UPI001AFDC9A0|nr:hypothetical protein [Paenibacillus sp. J2TS4]GIP32621.1 hypothetical protein J2TS4_18310 [Paenibacillus sp. J2TS4]
MLAVIIVVLAGVVGAWIDLPALWQSKQVKELVWFMATLIMGVAIGIIKGLQLPFPNLIDAVMAVLKPITDGLMQRLD